MLRLNLPLNNTVNMLSVHGASFRDPSGFIFHGAGGELFRQVNKRYEPDYRALIDSGLYE